MDPKELDAYLARIGYVGNRTPTLETLRSVHARHAETIAFENLDPFLGSPVPLDAPSLRRKLVVGGCGGYCFEHNLLFKDALTALGFGVKGLAARPLLNAPAGVVPPRGHMLLLVEVGGVPHIADVGFGGLTLTGPLRLEPDIEQATPHEPFRLTRADSDFRVQAKVQGGWRTLYGFCLQEQLLPDYEVTSWYLSNHPASPFVTGLIAARAAADRRYALRDNVLAVHHRDGATDRRTLTSAAQLRAALEELFLLTLPNIPELEAALVKATTRTRT